jgi:hypothetical protein
MLSISPCFNPICFAQSLPLLTNRSGPKGKGLHHLIESSILGSLQNFDIVLQWADQIPQKKVGLVRGIGQAKNGGELFWEEKFHAANEKAQADTQGALHFFLLSWGGWGVVWRGIFLSFPWFPPCSLLVPNKFPSTPQYVPEVLNVFTNMLSITTHL